MNGSKEVKLTDEEKKDESVTYESSIKTEELQEKDAPLPSMPKVETMQASKREEVEVLEGYKNNNVAVKDPLFYKIVRPLISLFVRIVYRPKYIGLEYIPDTDRIVLAGNHTNNFDCLLLISACKRCVHFMAKDSLMKGAKGVIFENMGIIPVNREIHDKDCLDIAIKTLNENRVVAIFPEGTINRTTAITMPFKIGAVKMARDSTSHIVPFVITGKYKLFSKDLTIEFLPPFKPKGEDLTEANEYLRETITTTLKRKRF